MRESKFMKGVEAVKTYLFDSQNQVSTFEQGKEEVRKRKRAIRDVLTSFVVKESTQDSTIKLIHLINTVMKSLFCQYYEATGTRLFFLYRGGNIIRIYREAFEQHITGPAREYFMSYFDEYFKQSDLDFYVVIEDHTMPDEQLEAIAADIQAMTYEALCYVRQRILQEPMEYITFMRYNKEYMDSLMYETLSKVQNITRYTSLSFGKGRKDFLVVKDGTIDIPYVASYHLIGNEGGWARPFRTISPFYISVNPDIRDDSEGMAFRLSRLMINFSANKRLDLPCELYDVSIGLPGDKMFKIYDKHSFRKYYYGKGESVLIPSLITLLKDLYVILFEYRHFPWTDEKYMKRIKRFMVLLMIHDMTLQVNMNDIYDTLVGLSVTNNLCRLWLPGGGKKYSLSSIPSYVRLVESRMKEHNGDKVQFAEMIAEIQSTANELRTVLEKVKEFISTDGRFYLNL